MNDLMHLFIGAENILRILIEKGANVNAVSTDNTSGLLLAATAGKVLN